MAKAGMTGVEDMISRMKKIAGQFPKDLGDAMVEEAEIEMAEAKRRAPVSPTAAEYRAMRRTPPKNHRPGTLRDSGRVHPPEQHGKTTVVRLSFGDPGSGAEDYAVVQHERLDFHHTHGQAKYLESVMNESRHKIAARIAAKIHFDKSKREE